MSNVEGMYPVHFIKKNEQSETTLQNLSASGGFCGSMFDTLRFAFHWFCSSLFGLAESPYLNR